MHVGLDGLPLTSPKTGVGHYTFELARALAAICPADTFELVAHEPLSPRSLLEIKTQGSSNLQSTTVRRYGKWWAIGLPRYLKKARLDLFHGTNYEVPLWNKRRNVLTIHDLSILLHADKHESDLARRMRRRLPIMVRSAAVIITVTEFIKREICEHLSVPSDLVVVTPGAPREIFSPLPEEQTIEVRRRLRIEDEFILFVGTLEPRKNLLTLVRAFDEILRTTSHRPQLVIAGAEGWLMEEFDAFVKKSTVSDRVRLTGYLSDEDLCALYSSCKVFVYPSIYEGFGLPPLEAMSCGAPVIASDLPVFRETLANAACLVDPGDHVKMARTIAQMLEDQQQRRAFASSGRAHALKFSWDRTARLTLAVYTQVLERSSKQ